MQVIIIKRVIRIILSICVFVLINLEMKAQVDTFHDYHSVLESMLYNNFQEASSLLSGLPKSPEKNLLEWHFNAFKRGVSDSVIVEISNKESSFIRVLKYLRNSKIKRDVHPKKDSLSIKNLILACYYARESKDKLLLRYALYDIISYLYLINEDLSLIRPYLKELEEVAIKNEDIAFLKYYENILKSQYENINTKNELKLSYKLIEDTENHLLKGNILQMIGVFESYFDGNQKEALNYWRKAANNFEKVQCFACNSKLFGIYNNIAVAYTKLDNRKDAFEYYYRAKLMLPKNMPLQKAYFFQGLAEVHKKYHNVDSAFYYLLEEKKSLKDHYDESANEDMRNLLIKYQTAEKEKQLLIQTQKAEANRNWLIALGLALFLGTGIAILLQKNTTKKRLLAEQEAVLKQQRVENLIKEQELLSIDAMIAGQEKERQRLANDLHDNLGSLLTSLKMHFQSLKPDVSSSEGKEITRKTEALMEEAYQKVRGIAHARNAGLKANEGLLPAVQHFAKKVGVVNKLKINVEEHGMTNRLENSLEITLFRVIQELVTNVAKHAEATECTIHLTNHEHTLNIMVEDNGRGFAAKEITKKEGMGLYSIQKRIENLDGQVTIDSVPDEGTSVIIDIPLA